MKTMNFLLRSTKRLFFRPSQPHVATSPVPFHPKVSNSVRLSGHVRAPLRVHTTPDGSFSATTLLTASNSIRIPITFHGNLAHLACMHIKDGDHVDVAGTLSSFMDHVKAIGEGQAPLQIKAETLDLLDKSFMMDNRSKDEESDIDHIASSREDENPGIATWKWNDLIDNPKQWIDYRDQKRSYLQNHADFKKKDSDHALWIDEAPEWVLQELKSKVFKVPSEKWSEKFVKIKYNTCWGIVVGAGLILSVVW